MYTGFNIKIDDPNMFDYYYDIGEKYLSEQRNIVEYNIDKKVFEPGYLDGSAIQEQWFPKLKANVFLSHSHKNEKLVVSFAGWLKEELRIESFVDSLVWGYAEDLLKEIDNKYCLNKNNGSKMTYDYRKRNISTSNVYIMLGMAIAQMIDNCECLFFINTPDSINITNAISRGVTLSPWIYSEIALSKLIRNKELSVYRQGEQSVTEDVSPKFMYNVDLKHLTDLGIRDLEEWENSVSDDALYPLDNLYKQMKY